MIEIITTGFLTGLALIAAVGAQAAFVLRQGIRREHVGLVVALCIIFDIALIAIGIGGVGAFVAGNDLLFNTLKYGGAGYLLFYALTSFNSAFKSHSITAQLPKEAGNLGKSRASVALATTAITFLNPHVYLDTVLMLGNIAVQFEGDGRWFFGIGAMAASVVWFIGIGFGAQKMAPWLASPKVWRGIDIGVGVLMILIAIKLLISH